MSNNKILDILGLEWRSWVHGFLGCKDNNCIPVETGDNYNNNDSFGVQFLNLNYESDQGDVNTDRPKLKTVIDPMSTPETSTSDTDEDVLSTPPDTPPWRQVLPDTSESKYPGI